MSAPASGLHAVRIYLEMIKIEHSIFALPFAMIGMMWAANGWPGLRIFMWIVVAMVSCRASAMAFNRIADREIDALNPRTAMRAIPAGLLRMGHAQGFLAASIAIFLLAAWQLNPLTLMLSPVALVVTLGYSMTKRFTPLCHFVLGLSLGIAPAAAWIAVKGSLDPRILTVTVAVLCWTAGFDILYALQDEGFDREKGLRSLPESIGTRRALIVSRLLHSAAVASLLLAGWLFKAGVWYYLGAAGTGALLAYEQSLVRPNDLSRINLAFFTLNGYVSLGMFAFTWLDWFSRGHG